MTYPRGDNFLSRDVRLLKHMDGMLTEDWSEFVNESYKSRKQTEFMTNKDLFNVLFSKRLAFVSSKQTCQ